MPKDTQLDLFVASVSDDYEVTHKKVTEQDLQNKFEQKLEVRKLTPREREVYRLIYHNSIVENRRTTQREIYEKVNGFTWNDDVKAHDHCPAIWTDIKNNNESLEHEKIIISFNFEYWIGNEEETKVFLDKLWNDLCPRLTRYWKYCSKVKKNGQGRLLDKNGNPINYEDKDQTRRFIESYGKGGY